ncbi:nuclear transport factor 2 family protein [Flagellimonas pelagia]|uniref:Steroid delta-isomerase n=1 Tax=Flagellimonas pelagia TaxID=2306998 RepID=A0A3A1NIK4_9FLAO|nr:nuclear transport factor 2 family protein [Allomuricauda maritima]RIV42173.1 steroid delta-isomerase [Allomuricauda maritima]TXJ91062.1 steroid delta-isomerase [Allomuricauda maritima]
MISRIFIIASLLGATLLSAQPNTEVYLFDLSFKNGVPLLSNPKNISNNDGYDNQPSFWDDDTVLFASTRDDQTDVRRLNINEGSTYKWLTNTPTGSEYSPLKIPDKNAFSTIRLDLDGLQRLYEYDLKTGESIPITNLKIGYHVWVNKELLVATVLVENRMDLVVINLKDNSHYTVQKNVGRSLHKIPNNNRISYIDKSKKQWEIKSMDPVSGATNSIAATFENEEDICWLNENIIITGHEKSLLTFNFKNGVNWEPLMTFDQEEINKISRIAINPSKTRLTFVAEDSPAKIVQKQLDAYNARDIDAFLDTYSENIKLYNFPNQLFSEGKTAMETQYGSFFENTPDLHCTIKSRIVIGNKVIDEESVTANGSTFSAVAIYEVANGKIVKVTFLR